ncbi:endonuclease domain-containing protein [Trujillonella humicola]|uniref:endonuclease domain-containing protein n=1 Tax=Trujillonella humicola TaxID=3383699 RepID=UPI00390643ED
MRWDDVIREVLDRQGGLATRQDLLTRVPTTVLDGYVGRRTLARVLPHVYSQAGRPLTDDVLLRAALRHAGPVAALSHTTALAVWGLLALRRPLRLTVDQSIRRAGAAGVVVHRRLRFQPEAPQCVVRKGLLVTALPRSLVDSWPLLQVAERRPLLLDVARRGLVVPGDLRSELAERPNIGGHRALAQTIDLIEDGCQSELEAHGVLGVFRHRSLPRSIGQYRLTLPEGNIKLDRAWPEVKLAVELDGARHHTSPEDRRRDLGRDRALAALGWVVLRFTYADVLRDPDGVRRRVIEVYAARAAQLRVG